ncbi:MAG: hypothetical protein OXK79_07980 [Chloroflexota bacterium]|nr:hypothetical protein [Chloroflexota bacterium]
MRTFNTEGPVVAADDYHILALEVIDLDEVLGLVCGEKNFVLHAPRQSGKTSALLALGDLLNGGTVGDCRCVYADVEAGQAAREKVAEGMSADLSQLALRANLTLADDSMERICRDALDIAGLLGALSLTLSRCRRHATRAADRRDPATTSAEPRSRTASSCTECATFAAISSTRRTRTAWCSAAAPSTSRRSRCGCATSQSRKCARWWRSTRRRRVRRSRRTCYRAGSLRSQLDVRLAADA